MGKSCSWTFPPPAFFLRFFTHRFCYRAVKPNNLGAEILGMDQLNDAGAGVYWDPVNKTGKLEDI